MLLGCRLTTTRRTDGIIISHIRTAGDVITTAHVRLMGEMADGALLTGIAYDAAILNGGTPVTATRKRRRIRK